MFSDIDHMKPWGVDMTRPNSRRVAAHDVVELGHVAHDRSVTATRNPSLADLVDGLFGRLLDKEQGVRCCDWTKAELSPDEQNYAALDAYVSLKVYQKLLTITSPFREPVPEIENLAVDTRVLLYSRDLNVEIGEAKVLRTEARGSQSLAFVQMINIGAPGALRLAGDTEATVQSFHDEHKEDSGYGGGLPWPIKSLRVRLADVQLAISDRQPQQPQGAGAGAGEGAAAGAQAVVVPPRGGGEEGAEEEGEEEDDFDAGAATLLNTGPGYSWRSNKVKLDAFHLCQRISRTLSKRHALFTVFMSRLRDVFFIPNPGDIEVVKQSLKEKGLTDQQIEDKMRFNYKYFMRRVRRTIPSPAALEEEFKALVEVYAKQLDPKTNEPLFRRKTWAVYKTSLVHIKNGCVSDAPGVTYYIEIGVDSTGMPLFKCIRGTSALEGFHQKIRQLLRGFNFSPRLAIAILHDYIYRWNIGLAVSARGLPGKYGGWYSHHFIEELQDVSLSWNLSPSLHSEWTSSKLFKPLGEEMGFINAPAAPPGGMAEGHIDGDEDDPNLVDPDGDEARLGEGVAVLPVAAMPASSRDYARMSGASRPLKAIEAKSDDAKYYMKNYLQYHVASGGKKAADTYGCIDFNTFAHDWNEEIRLQDAGKKPKTDIFMKNAYLLKKYWEDKKRRDNTAFAIDRMGDANTSARLRARDPRRAAALGPPVAPAARGMPPVPEFLLGEGGNGARAAVPNVTGSSFIGEIDLRAAAPKKKKTKRCRQCGKDTFSDDWRELHTPAGGFGNAGGSDQCRVPEAEREEGFPCPVGTLPRKPRKPKRKLDEVSKGDAKLQVFI